MPTRIYADSPPPKATSIFTNQHLWVTRVSTSLGYTEHQPLWVLVYPLEEHEYKFVWDTTSLISPSILYQSPMISRLTMTKKSFAGESQHCTQVSLHIVKDLQWFHLTQDHSLTRWIW